MFDIICTFGGGERFFSILDFQKLSDSDIEKLRHSLIALSAVNRRSTERKVWTEKRPALDPGIVPAGKPHRHLSVSESAEMRLKFSKS